MCIKMIINIINANKLLNLLRLVYNKIIQFEFFLFDDNTFDLSLTDYQN